MKTRLLIIIGIVVTSAIPLLYYATYDSSTTVFISCIPKYEKVGDKCVPLKPEQYCKDWCDLEELSKFGCTELALDHVFMATNLFDEEFDGNFLINLIGLPADLSQEELDKCVQIVTSIRK